jgi:hypothetical protein
LKRFDFRFWVGCLAAFILAFAVIGFADELNIDINAFEEFTPDIQEVSPTSERAGPLQEITVKPIEIGREQIEFEDYRPGQATPVFVQTPEEVAPPPPAPAPREAAPVVKMVEQGPELPPIRAAPLIPVEPPPDRQQLRVPEEIQVAQSYRPDALNLTLDKNYEHELADLQRQLALLRERVVETKSRVITYGERVAQGYTSGTRLVMQNENALGKNFLIDSITYFLDGHQIYAKKFDGEVAPLEPVVFRGSILPGKHKVDIEVVLRASSGMFDFSHSARLKLTTSEYFSANEGKQLNLRVRYFDKGGLFTGIEERPGISFEIAEEDAY